MKTLRFAIPALLGLLMCGVLLMPRLGEAKGKDREMGPEARVPVLVELFTSEGCSDCPPADALLERLDRAQAISGAEVIVLSEHVDYWNSLGWSDPYSSHDYSVRQGAYGRQFGLESVYTPQMVVDGRVQFVGSDESGALRAIESEGRIDKTPIHVSSLHFEGPHRIVVRVEAGASLPTRSSAGAEIFVAIADDSDVSTVTRGENAGRTLKHVAVVRSLVPVGKLDSTGKFSQEVTLNFNGGNTKNLRIVAILQEPAAGVVLGVGSASLSN